MTGRLVLLAWSPRVAPGLLSWRAWDVLRSADAVLAASTDHPLAAPLRDAGVLVETLDATAHADPVPAAEPVGGAALGRALLARAAAEPGCTVVWLLDADGDPALTAALTDAPAADGPVVEVLPASYDLPGARLLDLVRVMDRLRSPGGCPWDAEQTHESLVTYLLEETYETVEAIETGDLADLREELGDLLLQVVFHARIGEEHEHDAWSVDDVAQGIVDKLVRRHPHVFGDADAGDAAALERTWDELKRAEKGRRSVADGVPLAQPALSLASRLHDRARRAGLPVPAVPDGLGLEGLDDEGLGELLLGVVVAARAAGLDPEAALRAASRRYADRLRTLESDGST